MAALGEILNIHEILSIDVFSVATMQQRLSAEIYRVWKHCTTTGKQQDLASCLSNSARLAFPSLLQALHKNL